MLRAVILALTLGSICQSLEMAKLYDKFGFLRTSSTLGWESTSVNNGMVENAVAVVPDGEPWCRGRQHATWLAGKVVDKLCKVPFLGKVYSMENYDVLVSVNGSARLNSIPWDRFRAIPINGITASQEMILATWQNKRGDVLPGYISVKERRAYLLQNGKSLREDEAFLLIEVEPVRYELSSIVLDNDKRQESLQEREVLSGNLSNPSTDAREIRKEVSYKTKKKLYWGTIKGTIVGLNATVVSPWETGNLTWGTENELPVFVKQIIAYELPAGSAIDFKLLAIMQREEYPYQAVLTSIYEDDQRKSRIVSGLHIGSRLGELRVEFGQPYREDNGMVLDNFPARSQVLLQSSTTTTPPSSMREKPQSDSLATSSGDGNNYPRPEEILVGFSPRVSYYSLVLVVVVVLASCVLV